MKKLEEGWKKVLSKEFSQPYFKEILNFLKRENEAGIKIYPAEQLIFSSFDSTPFSKVKAVVIGQDPYHNPGQAMGLSFSVPKEVSIPPSLRNIYKEIYTDLAIPIPDHGDLSIWAERGVLMLNAILTVEHKKAGSHRKIGWEKFTDAVIKILSEEKEHVVFLLWGNFAKSKRSLIDESKHLILEAAHPSPLARGAFFGSKHFSKTNTYLEKKSIKKINWAL